MDDIKSVRETGYRSFEKCICLELHRNKKASDIYLRTEVRSGATCSQAGPVGSSRIQWGPVGSSGNKVLGGWGCIFSGGSEGQISFRTAAP